MDIPREVNRILHDRFEIPHGSLTPDTQIYTDLDLDSLDAADLLVMLESLTGLRIMPVTFLEARTLQDVYDLVTSLVDSSERESDVNSDGPIGTPPAASETTVPDNG
jgi:acyl carrier protein